MISPQQPDRPNSESPMEEFALSPFREERLRRLLVVGLLALLAYLVFLILRPFLSPLIWSMIISLSLWPLRMRILAKTGWKPRWGAILMTTTLTVVVLVPLIIVGLLLVGEAQGLGEDLRRQLTGESGNLADHLRAIPLAGEALHDGLLRWREHPSDLRELLERNRDSLVSLGTRMMSNVTRNLFKLAVCILSTYFLLLHGRSLGHQLSRGLLRVGGPRGQQLLSKVQTTVRATVYGLLMTALVQAALASLGYWVCSVPYPLLLGALTFVLAFIPFGPGLVWAPAGLWLILQGRVAWGIGLIIWGAAVISSMDNVLRPLFIGKATNLPVLLVFMGVLGGLMAFGMVGLFVGPVVMAVAIAIWGDWVRWTNPPESIPEVPPS